MGRMTIETRKLLMQGLKKCKTCEEILPLDKFRKTGGGRWYNSYCVDCTSVHNKEYRDRDPETYRRKLREKYHSNREHYRDLSRRTLYNVPLGTYDLLYEQQNGKCAICGGEKGTRSDKAFAIDHCAETNDIRGLLCSPCNQGIGYFKHNIELLEAAINYLLRGGYTIDELRVLIDSLPTPNPADLGL